MQATPPYPTRLRPTSVASRGSLAQRSISARSRRSWNRSKCLRCPRSGCWSFVRCSSPPDSFGCGGSALGAMFPPGDGGADSSLAWREHFAGGRSCSIGPYAAISAGRGRRGIETTLRIGDCGLVVLQGRPRLSFGIALFLRLRWTSDRFSVSALSHRRTVPSNFPFRVSL